MRKIFLCLVAGTLLFASACDSAAETKPPVMGAVVDTDHYSAIYKDVQKCSTVNNKQVCKKSRKLTTPEQWEIDVIPNGQEVSTNGEDNVEVPVSQQVYEQCTSLLHERFGLGQVFFDGVRCL